MNTQKPILFATLGYPGSGKTYFSRKFSKEFHVLHLNSDRIRKSMFKKPKYTQYENNYLFAVIDAIAEEAISSGLSVIYDANSSLREYRIRMQKMAKKYKARFFLLRFKTPENVAIKRLGIRDRCRTKSCSFYHPPIPISEFHRLKAQIEEPPKSEPHIIIDGTMTYTQQKKAVLTRIATLQSDGAMPRGVRDKSQK